VNIVTILFWTGVISAILFLILAFVGGENSEDETRGAFLFSFLMLLAAAVGKYLGM